MDINNHIEIMREDAVRQYRFRPNVNAPKPPERDRKTHGKKLENDLNNTVVSIESVREEIGIKSENLIVLEIESDAMSPKLLERMLSCFNIHLVEETQKKEDDYTRLIIQFDSKGDINLFNNERMLWENDDERNNILTYAQRRDLFSCIENIRRVTREDRMGPRLRVAIDKCQLPSGKLFKVDIDIWFNDSQQSVLEIESQLKQALGTEGSRLLGDLLQLSGLLIGKAEVNEYSLNSLLDLDIVSGVELPFGIVSTEPYEIYNYDYEPRVENRLDNNAPLATVLDSGIFTGNPLLKNLIVAEEQFDQTENTCNDINGHGTGVAGIVAYGDFHDLQQKGVYEPYVRLCSGKILHDENGVPCFPEDKRPELVISEAIKFFYVEYGCRIFNLSVGDTDHIYEGGRQFAWAAMLDQLSKELDIVIIVSAGNVSNPAISVFESRDELLSRCRDQLFFPEHRLIDPGTSALSVTVGSITRFDQPQAIPNRPLRISVGKKGYMSVFTRIGKGINKALKPDLVDYGGNFAITDLMRGNLRWVKNDMRLMEPTLNNSNERIFKGWCGTSFSAPHVTHLAARIERALEHQLDKKPSSNLIKALLVNTAKVSDDIKKWGEDSVDVFHKGKNNPKQQRRLRLTGFGKADDDILYRNEKQVTVFSEDSLELRSLHLYKIPVPQEFLKARVSKKISISLAYNPETRLNRKEYLANNLWFEVYRKIDEETLLRYKEKKEAGEEAEKYLDRIPSTYKANFLPGCTEIQKGTLQQRTWQKGIGGGSDLLWEENDPYIYVMITGKELFKHAGQDIPQDYALVITYSYEGDEKLELYSKVLAKVRLKSRQRQRERTQQRY